MKLPRQEIYVERTPYPGLAAFTSTDAEFFFGREREVKSFLNRLRVYPLLALVGPSGAGKSSFVQAGVIPGLSDDWSVIIVRPGSQPYATLAARLEKEGLEISDKLNPETLGISLRAAAKTKGKQLLLVVDQFEETFTLCLDQAERERYSRALAHAARSDEDAIRVVLTLRDDFLVRTKELPGLRNKLDQAFTLLTTPVREDLVRILTEPARRSGYEFEDQELPKEMAAAVSGRPGALPLLAFTTAKLWELRDRQFRQIRRKTYESMGGVGGALVQHAEEMLAQLTRAEQQLVRGAFRHLVTSEGTRAVLIREEMRQVLGEKHETEVAITSPEWRYYEIVGKIDGDAEWLIIGFILANGEGKVWIDDVSFEILEKN